MSWENFKRWLSKTFIGSTSEATWVWHRLNPSAPTITIPLKPFYTENKFNASFFQSVLQGTKDETSWDVETSDFGHIICMIEGAIEEKVQAHGIDLLYLNIVNSPRHGRVYLMVSEHGLPQGNRCS